MKKRNKIIAVIHAISALVMMGALRIWSPVCQKLLTLESGKQVHMKCFYTDRIGMILSGIILVTAIVIFLMKQPPRLVHVLNVVTGSLLILSFTTFVGVCMNSAMPCNATKLWAIGVGVVVIISGLVGLFAGREGQLPA